MNKYSVTPNGTSSSFTVLAASQCGAEAKAQAMTAKLFPAAKGFSIKLVKRVAR